MTDGRDEPPFVMTQICRVPFIWSSRLRPHSHVRSHGRSAVTVTKHLVKVLVNEANVL